MKKNRKRMREVFTYLIAIVLVLALITVTQLVENKQYYRGRADTGMASLYISPQSQVRKEGESFSFVTLLNTGGHEVMGMDINIDYDPSVIIVEGMTRGSGIDNLERVLWETFDNSIGKLEFSVATLDKNKSVNGSGLRALEVYGVVNSKASPGSYSIRFSNDTIVGDINAGDVLGDTFPGEVLIPGEQTADIQEDSSIGGESEFIPTNTPTPADNSSGDSVSTSETADDTDERPQESEGVERESSGFLADSGNSALDALKRLRTERDNAERDPVVSQDDVSEGDGIVSQNGKSVKKKPIGVIALIAVFLAVLGLISYSFIRKRRRNSEEDELPEGSYEIMHTVKSEDEKGRSPEKQDTEK